MRILMLLSWFSTTPGDGRLTNDLADELVRQGHSVDVAFTDWHQETWRAPELLTPAPGMRVLVLPPVHLPFGGRMTRLGAKWTLSSWAARRNMRKFFGDAQYDLLIGFSPATVCAGQINQMLPARAAHSYFVMWDFFPYHHASIGLLPSKALVRIGAQVENRLLNKFDVIGCMTDRNIAYLRAHYALDPEQAVELLPIWGPTDQVPLPDRDALRRQHGLPPDRQIVVFGGMLTEGRGLEDIVAAAEYAAEHHPALAFLVIGDGRLAHIVTDHPLTKTGTLLYRARVSRTDYLELISACDAGLACTVRNVDVPTFPSKTVDYLRAGLPIIASVEASTDYGAFIAGNRLGRSCLAGDGRVLADTAAALVADAEFRAGIRTRAKRCLDEMFDVTRAARRITARAEAARAKL